MTTELIGYTKDEMIRLMLDNDIHCSVDKFCIVAMALQRAASSQSADFTEPGPHGFDVKLGEQMYIDSSMHYKNGTVTVTIKRRPREICHPGVKI